MKRNLLVILACVLVALCIISCDDPKHEHSYGTEWKKDATNHWHECSCGAKKDEAAHTFESWTVEGEDEKSTCSVCKYEATREISKWDGENKDTTWYKEGTKEYTLTTAAQLAGLAKLVNDGNALSGVTIKLGNNINLNDKQWTPIGLYEYENGTNALKRFSGTFDGQNHEIMNLKIVYDSPASSYRALFGYVDGTVKNFTVRGEISACDSSGVVAALENGGKIENVTSYVNVTVKASYKETDGFTKAKAAGFVVATKNKSDAANPSYTISSCRNYGSITVEADNARDCLGGFVAYSSFQNLTIENCENYGKISTKSNGQRAGGIVGLLQKKTSTTKLKGCRNAGEITGTGTIGDIVGAVDDNATGTMTNCTTREGQNAIGSGDLTTSTSTDA